MVKFAYFLLVEQLGKEKINFARGVFFREVLKNRENG